MTCQLVAKSYELSANSEFPHDGIVATKMIMAIFENISAANGAAGLLEPHFPDILKLLMTQLQEESTKKQKLHREMASMIV